MLYFKRFILFLVAVSIIVFSITISGLNTGKIVLNLYFFNFELSTGFALILSIVVGLLIGLLMALFSFYMPLKSEIRKLTRNNRELNKHKLDQNSLEHNND